MSEAEHMMEGVSKAETEEIGRGQPLPGLPVHGEKKKKVLKHFCNNNVKPIAGFQ